MDHVRRVVLGLGSNEGDREALLRAAFDALKSDRELHVLRRAPTYETAAVGGPPQGPFLNTAVLLVTALEAREILSRTLAIEAKLGRVRTGERNMPRTIDIDILWIEGETVEEADLVVPHPLLATRVFAVRPLVDLAPDARDPVSGAAYADGAAMSEPLTKV